MKTARELSKAGRPDLGMARNQEKPQFWGQDLCLDLPSRPAWTLSPWPIASIYPQSLCSFLERQGPRSGVCPVWAMCMGLEADGLACVMDGIASPQIHNTWQKGSS